MGAMMVFGSKRSVWSADRSNSKEVERSPVAILNVFTINSNIQVSSVNSILSGSRSAARGINYCHTSVLELPGSIDNVHSAIKKSRTVKSLFSRNLVEYFN